MSESPKKEENNHVIDEDVEKEFSYLKPGEDYNSPEGPSELSEIRCPLCPKYAKITINHLKNEIISECPDNHYMKLDYASFIAKSTDHPIFTTKCSLCNSSSQSEKFCVECNKYLCHECLEKHKNNNLGDIHSNIRNNSNQSSTPYSSKNNDIINSSVPKHLSTLNKSNNNNSNINTEQHHVIDIGEHETHCALHNREKYSSFCLKCNKSFCEKCLEEINLSISDQELQKVFESVDDNGSGYIEYQEFIRNACNIKNLLSESNLKNVFQTICGDKEKMSGADIKNFIFHDSIVYEHTLNEYFEQIGMKYQESITFEQFYLMIKKNKKCYKKIKIICLN